MRHELISIMAEHIDNEPETTVPPYDAAAELAAWHLALDEAGILRDSRAWERANDAQYEHRMDTEHEPY